MNDVIISIIVPVYNVEKYINKCIDSILIQTFTQFELILVDDGSSDKSGHICDKYAKKDKRIKVIHKQNGGLSSARNAGLDIAIGEYIGFIDSDDFIDNDMFKLLIDAIKRTNSQIAITGLKIYNNNNVIKKYFTEKEIMLNGIQTLEYIVNKKICMGVCNKLYSRKIFESLRFYEGKIHEDAFIVTKIYDNDIKVVFINKEKYNYVIRKNSIMDNSFKKPNCDLIEANSIIVDYIRSKYPEKLENNIYGCIEFCLELNKKIYYKKQWYKNEEYLIKMRKFINKNKKVLLTSKKIPIENKFEICLFLIIKNKHLITYYLLMIKNKLVYESSKFRRES